MQQTWYVGHWVQNIYFVCTVIKWKKSILALVQQSAVCLSCLWPLSIGYHPVKHSPPKHAAWLPRLLLELLPLLLLLLLLHVYVNKFGCLLFLLLQSLLLFCCWLLGCSSFFHFFTFPFHLISFVLFSFNGFLLFCFIKISFMYFTSSRIKAELLHSFDPDFVGAQFHFPATCCTCRSSSAAAASSSSLCWKTSRIICSHRARLNLACGLRLGQLSSVDRELFALSVVRDVRETVTASVCVCVTVCARASVYILVKLCTRNKRIQKYSKIFAEYGRAEPNLCCLLWRLDDLRVRSCGPNGIRARQVAVVMALLVSVHKPSGCVCVCVRVY